MDKNRDIEGDEPSAADLVLDLLSAFPQHVVPVQALARAAEIMGIGSPRARVALTRLTQQGRIVKTDRGCYAMRPEGNPIYHEVEHWFEKESRLGNWNGGWLVVYDGAVSRADKTAWRRHVRAVELCGFQVFASDMAVRPDNLDGGSDVARATLVRLGKAPESLLFVGRDFDIDSERQMRALWDVPEMEAGYHRLMRLIERSQARIARAKSEVAARESMLVGRTLIRAIVRDPLLPEEIQPRQSRHALIEATRAFQAHARELWREVLAI
jgi:phenylacetic acid degradation operon negative regulatory protein